MRDQALSVDLTKRLAQANVDVDGAIATAAKATLQLSESTRSRETLLPE